jgi:hypothetical protein
MAEQSLRDVFNDVSKYIRNISMSLTAVLPSFLDDPDRVNSPQIFRFSGFSLATVVSLSDSL